MKERGSCQTLGELKYIFKGEIMRLQKTLKKVLKYSAIVIILIIVLHISRCIFMIFSFGSSMDVGSEFMENLNVATEIDQYFIDNINYTAFGAEYWPIEQLALRGGYRFGYHTESLGVAAGLGVGIGFRIWSAGLDYAFVPFGELGDTHRLSFVAKFK